MYEFFPWSRKNLINSLEIYNNEHRMSILDIELGGACNMCCVYCDTPTRNTTIQYPIEDVEALLNEGNFTWLFICGLGEPTVDGNSNCLKKLLSICEKAKVKCCLFSNIVNFDSELFSYIDSEVLYPMFKLDSLNPELLESLYGVSRPIIQKQLKNVFEISKHVKNNGIYTNICASIVPTKKNKESLHDLIDWCLDKGIFPLIGDLEDAGKGQAIFSALKIPEEELLLINDYISRVIGEKYSIPICPSVLFGIHIKHTGDIIVDDLSGLSCHWFWLKEPKIKTLARVSKHSSMELSRLIIENRKAKRDYIAEIIDTLPPLVFGGCGGNICDLLKFYIENVL